MGKLNIFYRNFWSSTLYMNSVYIIFNLYITSYALFNVCLRNTLISKYIPTCLQNLSIYQPDNQSIRERINKGKLTTWCLSLPGPTSTKHLAMDTETPVGIDQPLVDTATTIAKRACYRCETTPRNLSPYNRLVNVQVGYQLPNIVGDGWTPP